MRPQAGTIAGVAGSASRGTILVVDDEPTIAEIASRYLERAGFTTATAGDGLDALALVARLRPDLVVLDLMLPRLDGLGVLRALREGEETGTAVIVLTARGEEDDRLVGLRSGADDYMVKPFSPAELVARVDAVLRRVRPAAGGEESLRFDGLVIDARGRTVQAGDEEVELTVREFDLLHFLASHPGQAFTREQLMEHVWQFTYWSDTSTVTVHVRRLRAKVEPDPDRPRFIQTVWGVGYRFRP
jgi:two-component system, OmpR family, response regulator ResD